MKILSLNVFKREKTFLTAGAYLKKIAIFI